MSEQVISPGFQTSSTVNGKYQNLIETRKGLPFGKMMSVVWQMLKGGNNRKPASVLPTVDFVAEPFGQPAEGALVSWFGHSSSLVKFMGKNILFDPVFSPRASMFSFAGPKNFAYRHPMQVQKLPETIDMLVLSHDHYDHLDKAVMKAVHDRVKHFYVPLGVGARLMRWGVPAKKITEFDWWQKLRIDTDLELVCTPARHFSGRSLRDESSTLWCSWVFLGNGSRFYFSGDSGYSPQFKEIGEAYGPFDFAFIECGQYNEAWIGIHMMPEQSVQAAMDVKTALAIPIHWGKFSLALHPWNDSVQRFKREADAKGLKYFFPEIGGVYNPQNITTDKIWWEAVG